MGGGLTSTNFINMFKKDEQNFTQTLVFHLKIFLTTFISLSVYSFVLVFLSIHPPVSMKSHLLVFSELQRWRLLTFKYNDQNEKQTVHDQIELQVR